MSKLNEQARKAKRTLTSLLWSKYIQVNTNKLIFYTVTESNLSYGWKTWTVDHKLKKKLSNIETDFGKKRCKDLQTIKIKK